MRHFRTLPACAFALLTVLGTPVFASSSSSSSGAVTSGKIPNDHALPKTRFKEQAPGSSKEPVLLEASQVDYDHENDVVVASGNVSVAQGETIILANTLIYDRTHDTVTAIGDVSMLEPSGDVYFADAMELQNNMKSGVVKQFKARLSDDSVFVAAKAKKIDDNKTELFKAVYSPCKIACNEQGEAGSPLWQIRADHAVIDQGEQEVRYNNATMEFYGVPMFYTPYLSHATPGAENESGLLIPEYQHSTELGSVVKMPVYYAIARDKDVTITPIYTTSAGLVMAGQYRQMFDDGPLDINGSITQAPNVDTFGNPQAGTEIRGHINATGTFKLSDDYDWGFDYHHTSDDTYLHNYNFSNDTLLTSRAYFEGFNFIGDNERTYGSIQTVGFQGLTSVDNPLVIPYVLPLMDFNWQSDPLSNNSRFTIDGNAMSLYRQDGDESRRLSSTAGWHLPYITDDGEVIEFATQMRTDVYDVNDVTLPDGSKFDGTTGRAVPTASLAWRFPFINQFPHTGSLMIEPMVVFSGSPGGGNPDKIPNEDSLVPEFTDSNLFSPNRYAGLDRVENGAGVSYGVRGQAQLVSDKYIDWLFGQHYRAYGDTEFPFSTEPGSHFSDYVGKVGVDVRPFSLAYRFRLDRETFATNRNELDAGFNYYPVNLNLSYLSLKDDPILGSKQTVFGSANFNLSKYWMWTVNADRDLHLDQMTSAATGLTYKNECFDITTLLNRQYTHDLDIQPSTSFLFRVSLKNLD